MELPYTEKYTYISQDQVDRVRAMSVEEIEEEIREQKRFLREMEGKQDLTRASDYCFLLYDIMDEKKKGNRLG